MEPSRGAVSVFAVANKAALVYVMFPTFCHPAVFTEPPMTEHLTFADLVRRWVYTRRGLQKLRKRDPEFPEPIATIKGSNKGALWRLEDIIAYEEKMPELLDEKKKRSKVARFAMAVLRGG